MRPTPRPLFHCLLFLVIQFSGGFAQQKDAVDVQNNIVQGASGTEFWIAIPPNEVSSHPVDALEIYVSSLFDTEVHVYDASADRTYKRSINAGEVRTLTDARGETNWTWEIREFEQVVRKGIRLTADYPINVFVINAKSFTSDGYMALPVRLWDTEHIVSSYYDFREIRPWGSGFTIVAREDDTRATITLRGSGKDDGATSGGRKIGDSWTINMDAGDVYHVAGDGTTRGVFNMTGTLITSNKPVGLISSHQRTTMPNLLAGGNGRDHLVEMTPATSLWGTEYSTLEYQRQGNSSSAKGDVFTIVCKEDNTRWRLEYFDPVSKAKLGQGGGILAKAGDFIDIAQSVGPTVLTHGVSNISADKPILVSQLSASASFDGDRLHDPFMIHLTPKDQATTSAVFMTPTDTKFVVHKLALMVWADTADNEYVENLKSLEINGEAVWRHPLSGNPTLLFNHMGDNLHWAVIDFGTDARAHSITSNGKVRFTGYVYGFGAVDSYGWPITNGGLSSAGTGVDTLSPLVEQVTEDSCCRQQIVFRATENRNDPDPPSSEPDPEDQVETGIGRIVVADNPGAENLWIDYLTSTTLPFNPSFKDFEFRVRAADTTEDASGRVEVTDFAYNSTSFEVEFRGRPLLEPSTLDFGATSIDTTKSIALSIVNNTRTAFTIDSIEFLGDGVFALAQGESMPIMVRPGSRTLKIVVDPKAESEDPKPGKRTGIARLYHGCCTQEILLEASIGRFDIDVPDIDFGMVPVGETTCDTLYIHNRSTFPVKVVAFTGFGFAGSPFSMPEILGGVGTMIPPTAVVPGAVVCYSPTDSEGDTIEVTVLVEDPANSVTTKWRGNSKPVSVQDEGYPDGQDPISIRNTVVHIELTGASEGLATIHDLNGRLVWTRYVTEDTDDAVFDTANLSTGSYVVVVVTGGRTFSRTIQVVR